MQIKSFISFVSHRFAGKLVAAAGNWLICVNLGSVNKLIAGEGAFDKVDILYVHIFVVLKGRKQGYF